jgi:dTDP-4-dehydrorhamnose 3,5-epimerase
MEVIETRLDGPVLLEPAVFGDERGFFLESWRDSVWAEAGVANTWVQDNHSRSRRGVLRGLHFAIGDGQAKLVRCGRGAIVDVLVDLRRGSPTWAEWEAFELSEDNHRQLYAPVGFAHGFVVTSDVADVMYKLDSPYDGSVERGIRWDDPQVGVEWPSGIEFVLSERDQTAPLLSEIADELPFTF